MKNPIKVKFTDFWTGQVSGKVENNPIYKLLKKHFNVELNDAPDFLIYDSNGWEFLRYDCPRIFYTGENHRPNFDQCDFAFSFDYPFTERNYRLPLYRIWGGYEDLLEPRRSLKDISTRKGFCCFLASNSVPLRNDFFHLLSNYKIVHSGGSLFNNIGQRVPHGGEVNWMSNFKFSIVFENSAYPGYTTEKLMRALLADTIPIYWGNPLVGKDFNQNAFINVSDYDTLDQVVERVKEIDQNPTLYQAMLAEPYLPGGKETWFCQEENIVQRFEEIFYGGKSFVSREAKKSQNYSYYLQSFRSWLLRKAHH